MVFDRLLQRLLASGHRVLVFSQFTRTLDMLEVLLKMRGSEWFRLDGKTDVKQRAELVSTFNSSNCQVNVFLISTRAGGVGLNLQTADTCIIFDGDWNPQMDLQAMARVHRIGQTRKVHVYCLTTKGTVEERIRTRADKRLHLAALVAQSCASSNCGNGGGGTDMLKAIRFGADAIVSSTRAAQLSDAEVDAIIDRA